MVGSVIRIDLSSADAAPRPTYFCIPDRLEYAALSPDGKSLLSDDAFRTWLRREYGNESIFARQRDYLEEMAAPRHLNFDASAFHRTFPKAIAFEPEENVEKFIREFILEESPLDVRDVKTALRAYEDTRKRLEKQEDEAAFLRRIYEQHVLCESSRRAEAILLHTGRELKLEQAEERQVHLAASLKRQEEDHADDLKQLAEATKTESGAKTLLEQVRFEVGKDPDAVKIAENEGTKSIKDNREAPPSVLVSELFDYVAQRFELPGRDIIEDHVLTRQRLQAFSTAYFQGGKLFSYSRENLKASLVIAPERKPPGNLVPKPLPDPEPEWRRLTLQTLAGFFCNPAKFLTEKRLGLKLLDAAVALDEREAFDIVGLERYSLQQELLELKVGGLSLKDSCNLVRAAGRLPAGVAGDVHFAQIRRDVEVFNKRLQPFNPGMLLPLAPFELAIGDFLLSGNIGHATPAGGLLFYRLASIKPKDLLRAWVPARHCRQSPPSVCRSVCRVIPVKSIPRWRREKCASKRPVLPAIFRKPPNGANGSSKNINSRT
jgi:hypothetical protein